MTSQIKLIKSCLLAACTGLSYLSFNSTVLAEKPSGTDTDTHQNDCNECSLARTEILPNAKSNIQNLKWQRLRSALKEHAQTSRQPVESITPSVLPTKPPIAVETLVRIEAVQVLGSTVFSQTELDKVVQPFIGQTTRFEQILAIRTAVTDFYTSKGYTTSGAYLPPQDISTGVVKIQVVEGELENIEIQGLRRLRQSYVRDRIRLASGTPINLRRLETALQLLQIDPLFASVKAELKAGTTPGRSVLSLTLKEATPLRGGFTIENRDSPSVGSLRGSSAFSYQNLLGLGDRLTTDVGYTAGSRSYDLGYAIPLNARDGTLNLRYVDSNSRIIEKPFSPLDILGRTKTFSIGFRQPIVHTQSHEFALSFSADLRQSRTFLLDDIPYSFSTGPENGKSRVTVLRFSQDWINRSPKRVLAARSQFSWGIDAFDATVNNTGVDGRFVSWMGQFQWVQSLSKNFIGVARIATQLTPDSLLPLEQFSIGGVDTVRGYRQNQFVADNGITGSLEVRFPIVKDSGGFGTIQLAPFLDFGKVWNNKGTGVDNRFFASTGLSLRWQYSSAFSARLDWGIPLTSIDRQGDSLQDNGIYFSLMYQPF